MSNFESFTVYLSASGFCTNALKMRARNFGISCAKKDIKLVYGGMDAGAMYVLAKSAKEAGGHVTGILPQNIESKRRYPEGELDKLEFVETMSERKRRLAGAGDAIVALDGGFGTMDELVEAIYWSNIGYFNKPIVIVNVNGFYDGILEHFRQLDEFSNDYIVVVSREEEIFEALENWQKPSVQDPPGHAPPSFDDMLIGKRDALIINGPTLRSSSLFSTAVALKQLRETEVPIGLLNKDGKFDYFLEWVQRAARENLITPTCLNSFLVGDSEEQLRKDLLDHNHVPPNLEEEKWGKRLGVLVDLSAQAPETDMQAPLGPP